MNELLTLLVLIAVGLWIAAAAKAQAINCTNRDFGGLHPSFQS